MHSRPQKQNIILPIIVTEDEQLATDNSVGLQPIYNKVAELKRNIDIKKEAEKEVKYIRVIELVPKKEVQLPIDRRDEFIRRKLKGFETFYDTKPGVDGRNYQLVDTLTRGTFEKNVKRKAIDSVGLAGRRSKSERMINFLRSTGTPFKRPPTPDFNNDNTQRDGEGEEEERQSFTPMRPISKSKYDESVSGTSMSKVSGSYRRSSGGYSQMARLSNAEKSNGSSTPSKYLRKGHRMRETLVKQFQIEEDMGEKGELHYLKQYDQWVPAELANFKKMQLEHFMGILVGNKRVEKEKSHKFVPIYL